MSCALARRVSTVPRVFATVAVTCCATTAASGDPLSDLQKEVDALRDRDHAAAVQAPLLLVRVHAMAIEVGVSTSATMRTCARCIR